MNEVKATPVVPASPQVAHYVAAKEADRLNALPPNGSTSPTDIEQAVIEINEYVQLVHRDLHFSIDEESGMTVVRVRDKESGELIRQIPEDIFLSLAHDLKENQAINLFDVHG